MKRWVGFINAAVNEGNGHPLLIGKRVQDLLLPLGQGLRRSPCAGVFGAATGQHQHHYGRQERGCPENSFVVHRSHPQDDRP